MKNCQGILPDLVCRVVGAEDSFARVFVHHGVVVTILPDFPFYNEKKNSIKSFKRKKKKKTIFHSIYSIKKKNHLLSSLKSHLIDINLKVQKKN